MNEIPAWNSAMGRFQVRALHPSSARPNTDHGIEVIDRRDATHRSRPRRGSKIEAVVTFFRDEGQSYAVGKVFGLAVDRAIKKLKEFAPSARVKKKDD